MFNKNKIFFIIFICLILINLNYCFEVKDCCDGVYLDRKIIKTE
jgi:hypothetical protein